MAHIFYSLVIIYYNYSWICNYHATIHRHTGQSRKNARWIWISFLCSALPASRPESHTANSVIHALDDASKFTNFVAVTGILLKCVILKSYARGKYILLLYFLQPNLYHIMLVPNNFFSISFFLWSDEAYFFFKFCIYLYSCFVKLTIDYCFFISKKINKSSLLEKFGVLKILCFGKYINFWISLKTFLTLFK